ncbi:MAG TPA: chemotaxis response regulator protein-glutamate methylesterase [Vicinamibacteria bacterium]
MTGRGGRLGVLVVDDSAVVRQVMTALLSQEPDMAVAVAADPLIAMEKMRSSRPDVILLDLEMPRMDGMTFLRRIMKEDPLPVVVLSTLATRGAEAAVRALDEGAVAVVAKPRLAVRSFLHESAVLLIDAVRAAAQARLRRRPARSASPRWRADVVLPAGPAPRSSPAGDPIVAVGASTGGTEALRALLEPLPPDAPPLVIVQHMPEVFTRAFAARLDQVCRIEVKEAAAGDRILRGRALVAPGNRHLVVRREGSGCVAELSDGPLVSRHRPSVDVLFRSVAQAAGANAVGVILTGMGDDGAAGLLEMKEAGATTFAQDEATCVVFGMPKEAILRGAVDHVLPLSLIPRELLPPAMTERRGSLK